MSELTVRIEYDLLVGITSALEKAPDRYKKAFGGLGVEIKSYDFPRAFDLVLKRLREAANQGANLADRTVVSVSLPKDLWNACYRALVIAPMNNGRSAELAVRIQAVECGFQEPAFRGPNEDAQKTRAIAKAKAKELEGSSLSDAEKVIAIANAIQDAYEPRPSRS